MVGTVKKLLRFGSISNRIN